MLRVFGGQLSYLSPLDYVLLLIYFAGKISFNSLPCGEKKIQFQPKYLKTLKTQKFKVTCEWRAEIFVIFGNHFALCDKFSAI